VVVKNIPGSAWVVEEYAFEKGKYECGVRKDNLAVMPGFFRDLFKEPNNKRKESIFRNYRKLFARK
jgi:hypothetical protein